ncbi:MAG: hypothetical protein ACJ8DG_09090 [Microvirga sp.]
MKAAAAALALLAGATPPTTQLSGSPQVCVPPPTRTTPRGPYERADKWQRDQRIIA